MGYRHNTLVAAWRFQRLGKFTLKRELFFDRCDKHLPNHVGVFLSHLSE